MSNIRDITFAAGLILLTAGGYCIWPPLALLAPGVVLMTIAVWGHFHDRSNQGTTSEVNHDPE